MKDRPGSKVAPRFFTDIVEAKEMLIQSSDLFR